jgi:hypothetical protein
LVAAIDGLNVKVLVPKARDEIGNAILDADEGMVSTR